MDELVAQGALILDVRTRAEFQQGHVKGSKNIPLNNLSESLSNLTKNQAIITCCASGMRSGAAKNLLKKNGFLTVQNGGSWQNLRKYSK